MAAQHYSGAEVDLEREVRHDSHGHRLTEADVNDAAAAIEHAELEIDESSVVYPRRGRGRPSLSEAVDPGEASPKVEARVPPALKSRLARHAEKHGQATAEVVREALEEYLAHH
jgi:hypothetical protein